ncbi:hypothetical protein [Cupriavidus gilardii]|uniref:hypothetical protein n=2 Tax=Cupriavidus gilardii TaxID=82541 RepID=UPI001573330E|nr:hypothetical protein [Cupriavidus gilardii]NSX02195.1 hypothetical protein [Cupriavidus gilardii]
MMTRVSANVVQSCHCNPPDVSIWAWRTDWTLPDFPSSAVGYPDDASAIRHQQFDIKLPAGIEKNVAPVKLLALANGYINGTLSKSKFLQTVKLLQKPQAERRTDDLFKLGIPCHLMNWLMLDDWAIIGLMNGVIDIEDYDFISMWQRDLTDTRFWAKHFPRAVDKQGTVSHLPDIELEDWYQIGCFTPLMPWHRDMEPPTPGVSRHPVTLERIRKGFSVYSGRIHYLVCMTARRVENSRIGPLGRYRNEADVEEEYCRLFWNGKKPEERQFFPCNIV